MAVIEALSIEHALVRKTGKEASVRTLRTRRIEGDVQNTIDALISKGAAIVHLSEEDAPVGSYLNGFRAALQREGRSDVLVQKRRAKDELIVWLAREEDQARIATRKETGRRLGQLVKDRWATPKPSPKRGTRRA